MADIASLSLEVKTDSLKQATAELRELPKAASAAERAAQKWGQATNEAARSTDDFSKRVQRTIKDLEFERQQLARSATERQKYATLRRAGVAEASAEGVAILASVRALEAQKAALGNVSLGARAAGAAAGAATNVFRTMAATLGPIALLLIAIQKASAAFEFASGLDEAAEQIGVTAKNLQALQFAATQSGVKMEQLDTGLTKFSQKMGEAAEGSKEMVESLQKLGVKNLDVAGKLRPTEDILVDVAKAITSIDDPARRSAAAVDFFGKAGTRMLPALAEIAGGMDALGQKASDAGAIIDAKTITALDNLADSMARAAQVTTARLANGLATLLTIVEGVALGFSRLADSAGAGITKFVDSIEVGGARASAVFLEMFKSIPQTLGTLFTNAWESARVATNAGINDITASIANSRLGRLLGLEGGTNLDTTPRGAGPAGAGVGARAAAAGEAAAQEVLQRQMVARQAAMQDDEARARAGKLGVVGGPSTTGAATSAIKGSGSAAEDAEKKYAKLITTLTQTATAQDQMTAAAGRGETAFEATKVHLEAQQKALEIYGKALDDTDPKLRKIEELLLRISQGKAAEAFSVATTELERQNVILEKQIELMNQAPEIQAREIALIKAKQEAEKAGTAVTQEMIDARTKAIEQNETLKNQQEEIKRAQDLWTAPLKSALESIQSTAADAFEGMLQNGKFSFQELGDVFKKTITRMIAEFLALATVRPVMSVLLNAVSPGMAREMGLGSAGTPGMGSLNTAGGGGIFGNMFGGGGGGGFFGQTLIGGGENLGPLQPGAASLGSSGGLTVGGALGGAASIGMGAFQMLSGKGAGSMIGGGLGMLGGAFSMLGPALGMAATTAGPIGMGIGLLGSILPMLFGGGTPEPPTNRAISSLNFRGGQFAQSGGSYGMDAADLGGLGSSMKSLLDAAKVQITSSASGIQQQSYSKGDFSNATTFITGPGGQQMQWGQSSDPEQQKQALDTAAANVAHSIMLEVGSGISDVMREGLANFGLDNLKHAFSMEELGAAVQKLTMLDDAMASFGKTSSEAESAIKAVDDGFQQLFDVAKEFGISAGEVAKIEAERDRQRLEATKDFSKNITQSLLEMQDPMQAKLAQLEEQRQDDLKNNADFVRLVTGYNDQAANIEQLYYLRRNEVIDEANAAALAAQKQAAASVVSAATSSLGNLQGLIRSLSPGGALSNLDPAGQNAGLRASYNASYAQAIADPTNADAIARFTSNAQAFLENDRSFTGGSTAYAQSAAEALQRAQGLQAGVTQGARTMTADSGTHSRLDALLVAVNDGNVTSAERDAKIDNLIGLLTRYVAA